MTDDIFQLIDTITGYQPAAVVAAATRVGVFGALSPDDSLSADHLAQRLGTDPVVLRKLLAALEQLGLVAHHPGGYRATAFAAAELGQQGEMAKVVEKEAFFAQLWTRLADTVTSGAPQLPPWTERLQADPAGTRGFLEALDVLARRTGPDLRRLRQLAPGRQVLDVGSGLGTYALQLLEAGSQVTLVDLPPVIRWAMEWTRKPRGAAFVACDVLAHPSCGVPPGSHDAALISHLLHDLPPDQARAVVAAAVRAVRPGGFVVINDFAADRGGGFGAMFDLMMSLETGGHAYPLQELAAMAEGAGLRDVKLEGFDPPLTVVSGVVA